MVDQVRMYVNKGDYDVMRTRWGHGNARPPAGVLTERMLAYITYLETALDAAKSELAAIKEERNV